MRTSKPFSTISYNTDTFLKAKLDEYVQRGIISFYAWIEHHPEEDEKKKHKHLFIVPDGRIDTSQLANDLKEIDIKHLDKKPLGIIPVKSSKFDDWYLYGKHDEGYLASKGQVRKYHYEKEDFVTSDNDYFVELIHMIDFSKYKQVQRIKEAVMNGIPFEQMVFNGQIPLNLMTQARMVYDFVFSVLNQNHTIRNGRDNHELDDEEGDTVEDIETGELYEIKKSTK